MAELRRAIRMALRYRLTLAGIFLSAVGVAILWGGNIGALFPVIKVALRGQPVQVWLDEEIQEIHLDLERAERDPKSSSEWERAGQQRQLAVLQRIKPLADQYLPRSPFRTVMVIILMVVCATAVKGGFVFLNTILLARLVQRVVYDLRRDFFRHALRRDLASFGQEGTSGLLSRFHTDIGYLATGIEKLFGHAVREPLKMIACLIGASLISWQLLLLSLLITPLTAYLVKRLAGSIKRANRRAMEEISALFRVITETFDGIQTVQAYNLEGQARQRFHTVSKQCLHKSLRIALYNALTKPITEVLGISIICVALLAGAHLVLNQQTELFGIPMAPRPLSQTALLVFFGFLIGATEPARKMTEVFHAIQGATAAAERLFPMLDQEPLIMSPAMPQPTPTHPAGLEFRNVHFAYHPGRTVLQDINFTIRPQETLAIIGGNGSGKSTLVNLLPRFLDPDQGQVLWDGTDLRKFRLKELRQRISFVAQDPLLFDDTVSNNIRAGNALISDADIHQAAREARADGFISTHLKHGYETLVGVSGKRLSGGQRQRIALARALARQPDMLVLDEATSQIDMESEKLIHQALEEFSRNRTVIMITHRLSSLTLADRILVLDEGHICDIGKHDELLTRCPVYQRLHTVRKAA